MKAGLRQLQYSSASDMPSLQRKAVTEHGRWSVGGRRAWAQFAVVCALVALIFALSRMGSQRPKWLPVQGTIQDVRVVPDKAVETNWGGQLTWKAEYRVLYSVAGREYALWSDSGIRRESEGAVRLALPQPRSSCQVRYNPNRPQESVANCR